MERELMSRSLRRMVQEQLLSRGIRDPRVIEAMTRVPRHLFVPEVLRHKAYLDAPLPIGFGQTISQPYTVALMTEALELRGGEKILEVGTGSGYQTAILAELSQRVFSIERIPELARRARKLLDRLGYGWVLIRVGDGSRGWPEEAPFDRILVTAYAPRIPPALLDQLAVGGKIVLPIGREGEQRLLRITRLGDSIRQEDLGPCKFVKLLGEEGWQGGR